MDSIFPLFVFIVVIFVIVSKAMKNSAKVSGKSTSAKSAAAMGKQSYVQTKVNRSGQTIAHQMNGNTVQREVKVVPNRESNPMYDMSTGENGDRCRTGYLLNESDHFDESAHPKLGYGQGIVAGCHYDWDMAHQGYKVVKCCYCGAGNEVPVRKNGDYKCYFCWKKL